MSRYQNTILWLGLVLIALNLVIHIADIKALLFGGKVSGKTEGNVNQPPQGTTQTPNQNLAPGPLDQTQTPDTTVV